MCLDDQILNTYLDKELTEPWKTQVEEHLSYCSACKSRYEQLNSLNRVIAQSRLSDDEISASKERVFTHLNNNYLSQNHKVKFFKRDFRIKTPTLLTAVAAFVFILLSLLFITPSNNKEGNVLIPRLLAPSEGEVVQVRATENLAANQILESLTLEEILRYLDSRGYEVDLRIKGIKPVGDGEFNLPDDLY